MTDSVHEALKIPLGERVDYLTMVASLASADGVVQAEELDALRALGNRLALPPEKMTDVVLAAGQREAHHSKKAIERLRGSELRFKLLADALAIALADGSVDPGEDEAIRGLAKQLGVRDDQLAALRKVADAVKKAAAEGASESEMRHLGERCAADLAAVGVPLGALAVGSAFGLSAVGVSSGMSALWLGLGLAGGLGVAIGAGIGTMLGVRWLYRRLGERSAG